MTFGSKGLPPISPSYKRGATSGIIASGMSHTLIVVGLWVGLAAFVAVIMRR